MGGVASLLRWLLSLLLKFYRVVPIWLTLIIAASFFSQICSLLSLLLPLKVVMLLGSEKVPSYALHFLPGYSRDALVSGLVGMTVFFFISHAVLEKLTYIATERACLELLGRTKKIVLFNDQNDVARAGFQKFSKILASAVFVFSALFALFWLYFGVAIVIVGYILIVLLLYFSFGLDSPRFSVRLLRRRTVSQLLVSIANLGFFMCFFFLVYDFLCLQPPGIVFAVAGLLLSRQLLSKLSALAVDLLDLWDQKSRVDVLFFHGKVWVPSEHEKNDQFWWLVSCAERQKWIESFVSEIGLEGLDVGTSELMPVGVVNVVGVKVAKEEHAVAYIFKVFGNGRQAYAAREIDLLSGAAEGLPAPELIYVSSLGEYPVVCFKVDKGRSPEPGEMNICTDYIINKISCYRPPDNIVERYRRSRSVLSQRFSKVLIERLGMAIPSHHDSTVRKLLERLESVVEILSSLPLSVVVPEFTKESVWLGESTQPVLLNWTQWSLDPMGAGLAGREEILSKAAKELLDRKIRGYDTLGSARRAIRIASIAYIFEEKIEKQRFSEALSHAIDLLAVLDGCAVPVHPAWYGRFMELQRSPARDEWVRSIFSLVSLKAGPSICVKWNQTRLAGTFLLSVTDSYAAETVWVKVFSPNRYDIALDESSFLESYGSRLRVRHVKFLRDGPFHVLVFTTPNVRGISKSEYIEAVSGIRETLLVLEVSSSDRAAVASDGSHRKLVLPNLDRLDVAVASSDEQKLLADLIRRWDEVFSKLCGIPCTVVVPDISPDAIFVSEAEGVKEYFLTSWVGWCLAPAGSGFDVVDSRMERIKVAFERVAAYRHSLAGVSVAQLEFSAVMYKFANEVERGRLSDGLKLVPRLLKCLDSCE